MTFMDHFKRNSKPAGGRPGAHPPAKQKACLAVKYFDEAEALRKAGKLGAAEKKYLAAIDAGEKDPTWQRLGPSSTIYESLAKLYCHMNQDQSALVVLDRYLSFCESIWKEDPLMKRLREKIEQGGFGRARIKGQDHTIIDFRENETPAPGAGTE